MAADRLYGLDLGTMNMKIFKVPTGVILNEKNMIATKKKKEVLAFGDDAYTMYERASDNININYPVKGGVIADMTDMSRLLEAFLKKINCNNGFVKSNEFYMAVPSDITEVEKRAFFDLVSMSYFKSKNIFIVEKPIAAALGEDIDIQVPSGTLIVDIGADTTEVSVLAQGGTVLSRLLSIGGNTMDESICNFMKKTSNIIIGSKTAEILKIQLGSAIMSEVTRAKVYGRDLITGLPAQVDVDSYMIFEAMRETVFTIVDNIKLMLERIPPELTSDVMGRGIIVTGGSSKIPGLGQLITRETGLAAKISQKGDESVARGLGVIMANKDLKHLAFSIRESAFD